MQNKTRTYIKQPRLQQNQSQLPQQQQPQQEKEKSSQKTRTRNESKKIQQDKQQQSQQQQSQQSQQDKQDSQQEKKGQQQLLQPQEEEEKIQSMDSSTNINKIMSEEQLHLIQRYVKNVEQKVFRLNNKKKVFSLSTSLNPQKVQLKPLSNNINGINENDPKHYSQMFKKQRKSILGQNKGGRKSVFPGTGIIRSNSNSNLEFNNVVSQAQQLQKQIQQQQQQQQQQQNNMNGSYSQQSSAKQIKYQKNNNNNDDSYSNYKSDDIEEDNLQQQEDLNSHNSSQQKMVNQELYEIIKDANRNQPAPKGTSKYGVDILNEHELKYFGALRDFKSKPKFKNKYGLETFYHGATTAKTTSHELDNNGQLQQNSAKNKTQQNYFSAQSSVFNKNNPNQQSMTHLNKEHTRYRDFFNLDIYSRLYLDGMPQGIYPIHIIKDRNMQENLVRNLLNVLLEKTYNVKYILIDYDKARKLFHSLTLSRRGEFNQKVEQTVIALEYIGFQILRDLKDEMQNCGITTSPLIEYRELEQQNQQQLQQQQQIQVQDDMSVQNYGMENSNRQQQLQQQSQQQVVNINNNNSNNQSKMMGSHNSKKTPLEKKISFIQQQQNIVSKQSLDNNEKQQNEQQQQKQQNNNQQQQGITPEQQQKMALNKYYYRHMIKIEQEDKILNGQVRKPFQYLKTQVQQIEEEVPVFEDNIYLFEKITEYLKDCIEVFRIMQRQQSHMSFIQEGQCQNLLNVIVQCRMNLGFLNEELKILEKKRIEKERFQKILDMGLLNQAQSMHLQQKIQEKELQEEEQRKAEKDDDEHKKALFEKNMKLKGARRRELIQQKYQPKNITQIITNSQLQLEKRLEKDTELLRQSYQKGFSLNQIADNRKRLRLQNMQSPFGTSEIKLALLYAKTIPSLKGPLDKLKNS